MLVGAYNEIVIQFGWLTFFGPSFPAGALFSIFSSFVQVETELANMTLFWRHDTPQWAYDIGLWQGFLEFASLIGVASSTGIVLFTSKKLSFYFP